MSQEGAAYPHESKLSPWLRGTDICVQSLTDGGGRRVKDQEEWQPCGEQPALPREKGKRAGPAAGRALHACTSALCLMGRGRMWLGHVHLITWEEKQNECVSSSPLSCERPHTNSTVSGAMERSSFRKSTYKTPGRQELCDLRCPGIW